MPPSSRNALIAGSVVLLHVGALWALHSGLLRRAVEVVVPIAMLQATLPPPPRLEEPEALPPPPTPKVVPPAPPPVARKAPPPALPPAPQPPAMPAAAPSPSALTATPDPQPPAPAVTAPMASPAPPAAPVAAAPAPRADHPISEADYLHKPAPEWSRLSQRLGESGRVVLRVLVGADGVAKKVQVKQSSGFARLDNAAAASVQSTRFRPAVRDGIPEERWVLIPFTFGNDNDGGKER